MRLEPNSLRFKISVLVLLILAAILVIYSSLLFISFRFTLYQELDQTLNAKAQKITNAIRSYLDILGSDPRSFEFAVSRVIARQGEHPHKNKIEKLENLWLGQAQPLGIGSDTVGLLNGHGQFLARSSLLNPDRPWVSQKELKTALKGRPIYKNVELGQQPLRLLLFPVDYERLAKEKRYLLLVATSRESVLYHLKEDLVTKFVFIAVVLAIASLLSQLFARRVLKPVRDITRTARGIDYRDLSKRIRTERVDVEIKDLVDAFNEMISRLERSFKYIAEFSGHVAHELKTPLAIMRGESELALRGQNTAEECRKVIRDNLDEVTRMTRIIEDLLLLTKLDYEPHVFQFQDFNLVEFFDDITESTRILAAPKEIGVSVRLPRDPIRVHGDPTHLRRLFFNLISNAIKFTPPKGSVTIEVARNGHQANVSVSDTGPGIAPEHLDRVFDKFFHVTVPGHTGPSGNGLGLSIAKSIARMHSGDIEVRSEPEKGSVFTVRLPLKN